MAEDGPGTRAVSGCAREFVSLARGKEKRPGYLRSERREKPEATLWVCILNYE